MKLKPLGVAAVMLAATATAPRAEVSEVAIAPQYMFLADIHDLPGD